MWARWCEVALAAWLLVAPTLLAAGRAEWPTVIGGCAALLLALASMCRRTRFLHLGNLALGAGLATHGWSATRGAAPDVLAQNVLAQNAILVGLLLAMFAIVPTAAATPPDAWRDAA